MNILFNRGGFFFQRLQVNASFKIRTRKITRIFKSRKAHLKFWMAVLIKIFYINKVTSLFIRKIDEAIYGVESGTEFYFSEKSIFAPNPEGWETKGRKKRGGR